MVNIYQKFGHLRFFRENFFPNGWIDNLKKHLTYILLRNMLRLQNI